MKRVLRWLAVPAIAWMGWVVFSIVGTAVKPGAFHDADAIVVLGAGVDVDQPSPVLKARLDSAADLFQSYSFRHIILTGGRGEGDLIAESEAGRNYLIEAGLSADPILIETQSTTTLQNLAEAKKILDARHLKDVTIVSDPLHLCRAGMMARDLGIRGDLHPVRPSAFRTLRTQIPFFFREVYFYHHYLITGE